MSDNFESQPVLGIERLGMSGQWRLGAAVVLGCGLWLGLLLLYVELMAGSGPPSVPEISLVMVITAAFTVVPIVLSQMTRGRWVLEDTGVHEKITPLVSSLPLGLHRERFIKWGDIESCGVHAIRLRYGQYYYYFRAEIPGQPRIDIARKRSDLDQEFTDFATEFLRLAESHK